MRGVIVIGAGGHGQCVADTLFAAHEAGGSDTPSAFLDDDERLFGRTVLGLPVLGPIESIGERDFDAAIVAVGDNAARRRLLQILFDLGIPVASAVHPSAIISRHVLLGRGVAIVAGVIVNTGASLGDGVILNTLCGIGHHCQVRSFVHIGPGVHLAGNVAIDEGTFMGTGSMAIPAVRVGAWSIVGAGAVVTKDIPAGVVAVGVPAKVIKVLERIDHQKDLGE